MSNEDNSSGGGGPREPAFHCTRIHVIHRNEQERQDRWNIVNGWMQAGEVPTDPPDWAEILINHGGGGGP
ncbi:MAG: hypothetical protein ACR2QC_07820 [Gammaproteobacteria bacterium]